MPQVPRAPVPLAVEQEPVPVDSVPEPRLQSASARLSAPPSGLRVEQPQQDQQDQGTDDRPDDPDRVEAVNAQRVVLDQVLQEAAHERSHDAEHDGAEDADGVAAWEQQPRDGAAMRPMIINTMMKVTMAVNFPAPGFYVRSAES